MDDYFLLKEKRVQNKSLLETQSTKYLKGKNENRISFFGRKLMVRKECLCFCRSPISRSSQLDELPMDKQVVRVLSTDNKQLLFVRENSVVIVKNEEEHNAENPVFNRDNNKEYLIMQDDPQMLKIF